MRLMAVGDKSLLRSQRGSECNRLWVLKNSFQGISITKFVRKLLNVRSPQTLEFAEITALFLFQHPQALSLIDIFAGQHYAPCLRRFVLAFDHPMPMRRF